MTLCLPATLIAVIPAAPAEAAWAQPGFLRSIGGRGEAGVYAWGMLFNPVSNEILVGDYWNYKVRRYDLAGHELGAFYWSPQLRKGQPYSISVDPRNGDIYVPEISDGKPNGYFARYDRFGTYLEEISTGTRYHAWAHIDANGLLYVADSHYWNNASDPPKIKVFDLDDDVHFVRSWGTYGSGPGQMGIIHGIETDAAGNVYVADAVNRKVHVYTSTGTWLRDFGSAGSAVGQFTGDLRGLAVDKVNEWVYVVDAEAAEIEKFSLQGAALDNWGSEGQGPGQYADGGRQVTVDASGDVWVADYGNFRFFRYQPDGTLMATYPDPKAPPPGGNFAQNRDVTIHPTTGNVWVADSWNNRFQEFAADGTFLNTWGIRNSHPPYGMDYPRGIGVDPATGNVWVASTRDHFIRVYDAQANYLFQVGTGIDSNSAGSFRWPMDIEFYGGKAFIADYAGTRMKVLNSTTGAELWYITTSNNGVAVDPATGNIYILSWSSDTVKRYSPTGSFLGSFGSRGTGNGQFQNGWDIDIVNGTVYTTDTQLHRVQAFSLTGSYLGKWGSAGTGAFQFQLPSGISHDAAGNIYVADAGNDRVQVFSPTIPLPSGDTTVPTATLTSPTAGQVVPAATVVIGGTAGDNVGIAKVEVAVKNLATQQWWVAKDAVWGTAKTWNLSARVSAVPTSATYGFSLVGVDYGTGYMAQVRVTDTTGNVMTSFPQVTFSTEVGGGVDSTSPSMSVTTPPLNQVVPPGPVTIAGEATDDASGVASADIAIKDRVTNLWWDPDLGSWRTGLKWFAVTVASPGQLSTTWSYVWTGSSPGGSYYVQGRAHDVAGNVTLSPFPNTKFTVSA